MKDSRTSGGGIKENGPISDPKLLDPGYPTVWSRLLCSARDSTLRLSHQLQVRDALWFLARQWQVGELSGFDGGSPVNAAYRLEQSRLTAYKTWKSGAQKIAPADPPLEVQVEREPVTLGLRGSIQLGLRFEAIVSSTMAATAQTIISSFRTAFPIDAAAPKSEVADPDAVALRAAVTGQITDGWKLYRAVMATPQSSKIPAGAAAAITLFTNYCKSLYTLPVTDNAWNALDLRYEFTGAVERPNDSVGLAANSFTGGELDWYSFDFKMPPDGGQNSQPVSVEDRSVIPHHITFPGMPTNKWWEFEDHATDLGALATELTDIPKMLVTEFAAACVNAWFEFSSPVKLGTLNRISALVVTDTFGVRTMIRPTGVIDPPTGSEKVWQMFTLSGDPNRRDTLLVAPVLGQSIDGESLEDVLFFRDDMAAMCWAVERSLAGPLDRARNAYEAQLVPPSPSAPLPPGVDVNYLLGTTVPLNWIPLVPFTAKDGTLKFRRGAMLAPDAAGTLERVPPRGVILTPGQMLVIRDQAVPRAGVKVDRYMRRTRWIDGSIYCWMACRVRPGRGEGSSGLAFDVLETPAPGSKS